jgi:hypothetical protein
MVGQPTVLGLSDCLNESVSELAQDTFSLIEYHFTDLNESLDNFPLSLDCTQFKRYLGRRLLLLDEKTLLHLGLVWKHLLLFNYVEWWRIIWLLDRKWTNFFEFLDTLVKLLEIFLSVFVWLLLIYFQVFGSFLWYHFLIDWFLCVFILRLDH